jgi:hypothetical protein
LSGKQNESFATGRHNCGMSVIRKGGKAMNQKTSDQALLSLPVELIDSLRTAECNPLYSIAIADGLRFPKGHHVTECLACQYDASLLRAKYAIDQPIVPLSLLLTTRRTQLQSQQGLPIEFSDGSTARLRLAESPDQNLYHLTLDLVKLTGRKMRLEDVVVERRFSEPPSQPMETVLHPQKSSTSKSFSVSLLTTDFDPNVCTLTLRIQKAEEVRTVRSKFIELKRRDTMPVKLVAAPRNTRPEEVRLFGTNGQQEVKVVVRKLRTGKVTMEIEGIDAANVIGCVVDGRALSLETPFEDGAAVLSSDEFSKVSKGVFMLELRMSSAEDVK